MIIFFSFQVSNVFTPLKNRLKLCYYPHLHRNHNEILRCYDTMFKHFPVKLVSGLINKVETSEEKLKIGALTVVRHLLHLPSTVLGDRLEDIVSMVSSRLPDTNRNVQRCLAQIILMLGHHGVLRGDRGRACLEFIIKGRVHLILL